MDSAPGQWSQSGRFDQPGLRQAGERAVLAHLRACKRLRMTLLEAASIAPTRPTDPGSHAASSHHTADNPPSGHSTSGSQFDVSDDGDTARAVPHQVDAGPSHGDAGAHIVPPQFDAAVAQLDIVANGNSIAAAAVSPNLVPIPADGGSIAATSPEIAGGGGLMAAGSPDVVSTPPDKESMTAVSPNVASTHADRDVSPALADGSLLAPTPIPPVSPAFDTGQLDVAADGTLIAPVSPAFDTGQPDVAADENVDGGRTHLGPTALKSVAIVGDRWRTVGTAPRWSAPNTDPEVAQYGLEDAPTAARAHQELSVEPADGAPYEEELAVSLLSVLARRVCLFPAVTHCSPH